MIDSCYLSTKLSALVDTIKIQLKGKQGLDLKQMKPFATHLGTRGFQAGQAVCLTSHSSVCSSV